MMSLYVSPYFVRIFVTILKRIVSVMSQVETELQLFDLRIDSRTHDGLKHTQSLPLTLVSIDPLSLHSSAALDRSSLSGSPGLINSSVTPRRIEWPFALSTTYVTMMRQLSGKAGIKNQTFE